MTMTPTRWASWIVVAILIPALIVLWGLPDRTADLWAWTFKPGMTAIFMGSCYAVLALYRRMRRASRVTTRGLDGLPSPHKDTSPAVNIIQPA